MGTIIESDSQYEVLEIVRDSQTGNVYEKIRYKGIGSEGFVKDLPGVEGAETITEGWYKEVRGRNEGPFPPFDLKRVVGVVKGLYDGKRPSESFDFKIMCRGRGRMTTQQAETRMENTLENCLDFARANIKAVEKATVTQPPSDDEAIDIDPIEGTSSPFTAKFEMLFKTGAWYGYGFPENLIEFQFTSPMDRTLDKRERTL